MTTMMMSVGERTREIGIKKSIGARKRDICAEFLTESITLSLLGSAGGMAAGLSVAALGCALAGVPFSIEPASLASSAGPPPTRQRRLTPPTPCECRSVECLDTLFRLLLGATVGRLINGGSVTLLPFRFWVYSRAKRGLFFASF